MRGIPFHIPNLIGNVYTPGNQPNNPGEPTAHWIVERFNLIPWPRVVGTVNALASNFGTPHMRAPVPVVNRYSPLPENYLFIAGIVGKSQG